MDPVYVTQTTIAVTILHKIHHSIEVPKTKTDWIVKRYVNYERKISWMVKRYGKWGRNVDWIVKWYGRKASSIVKRYEKYGRNPS